MSVLSLLLVLFSVTGPAPALPTRAEAPLCARDDVHGAADRDIPRSRSLGDLSVANRSLAVDRHVGRCRVPLIVQTGIGKR